MKKHAKYLIGIDSGSTMCKSVLFDGKNVIDSQLSRTGWNPKASATESFNALLDRNSLKPEDVCVSATGYGRESIDFADFSFTEITCHAFGGTLLSPDIQGIIDIGGQDSKVIKLQNGRVADFLMNDKCAAGTGRFLSMACDTLGVSLDEIDTFTNESEPISINSMCTVFAESEIIGLLSAQKDRSKIMAGILCSIAKKVGQLASKMDFDESLPLLMTGGLSRSHKLVAALSHSVCCDVFSHADSAFAGAIGACICAGKKL